MLVGYYDAKSKMAGWDCIYYLYSVLNHADQATKSRWSSDKITLSKRQELCLIGLFGFSRSTLLVDKVEYLKTSDFVLFVKLYV